MRCLPKCPLLCWMIFISPRTCCVWSVLYWMSWSSGWPLPSSYTFLHLLAQMCSSSVTPSVLSVAMYICELAALEYDMHQYRHSCRAAAALLVGQLTVGDASHLPILASAIRSMCIPVQQLGACMASLLQLQQAAYHHNLAAAVAAVARFASLQHPSTVRQELIQLGTFSIPSG